MKALCIGESSLETTCPINGSVSEGLNLRLIEKVEAGSGHAGNVAYLLGKWGFEVMIASMLGADDAANKIKKEYESVGVNTDYLETTYDKGTTNILSLVDTASKENTIFEVYNNSPLKRYSFMIEPDIIVVDGNDLNASVNAFDKYTMARRYLVATRNNNEIAELARFSNFIILDQNASEQMSNMKMNYEDSSTLVNVYNRVKQKYPNSELIIYLKEKGCIYSINGQIKVMPAVKVDIQDKNGGYDTFAGAFIYANSREFGMEKAIAYATIAASFNMTKLSSRAAIPTITEVSSYYDSKFGSDTNPLNQEKAQEQENPQQPVEQPTNATNMETNTKAPKEEVVNDNQQNA